MRLYCIYVKGQICTTLQYWVCKITVIKGYFREIYIRQYCRHINYCAIFTLIHILGVKHKIFKSTNIFFHRLFIWISCISLRLEYVIIKIPYIVNPGMMDEWPIPCLRPTACGHAESSQHPENEYLLATRSHTVRKKIIHSSSPRPHCWKFYKSLHLVLFILK
jgi:hypothetical protein